MNIRQKLDAILEQGTTAQVPNSMIDVVQNLKNIDELGEYMNHLEPSSRVRFLVILFENHYSVKTANSARAAKAMFSQLRFFIEKKKISPEWDDAVGKLVLMHTDILFN